MPAKNKPYEQFGSYILFKKLESDPLSELWRAGRIEGSGIGGTVALRRFTGGDRKALCEAAVTAGPIAAQLSGTSFARNQVIDAVDGIPFIAHEYSGGRSLRHIVDRARGDAGNTPNPIPIDQAIAVAEKIALSLATIAEVRVNGTRLFHGGLIPQLVWISEDGEIRVAGQQFGASLAASLSDPAIAAAAGRFFAPELHVTPAPSKSSEVFALGALLHLLITGTEPPDASNGSAFTQAAWAAKMPNGAPVPNDIRAILDKSFVLDPSARYASVGEMKQALSALSNSGQYAATTFNLAFYVTTLLKKELEGEAVDRDRESKLNVAPYLSTVAAAAAEPYHAPEPAMIATARKQATSRFPFAIAAAIVVAAVGVGGWFLFAAKKKEIGPQAAPVAAKPMPPRPQVVSQTLIASTSTAIPAATATGTTPDDAARKQAFEQAVEQKLQEEMAKLQGAYTKKLQQTQSKQAPVQVAATIAPPVRPADDVAPSAAQLDQQRLTARQDAPPPSQAAVSVPAPQQQPLAEPAAPAATVVHEGDVIDVGDLDTIPHVVRQASLTYPMMALRQRIETTIFITALVNEKGDVIDARILKGDTRFGFEEAAIRAVRATKFSPPMKDGKRVRTWFGIPVAFKL